MNAEWAAVTFTQRWIIKRIPSAWLNWKIEYAWAEYTYTYMYTKRKVTSLIIILKTFQYVKQIWATIIFFIFGFKQWLSTCNVFCHQTSCFVYSSFFNWTHGNVLISNQIIFFQMSHHLNMVFNPHAKQ